MNDQTRNKIQTGEWIEDVPDNDGRIVWMYSTDYDGTAENYWAEVTGEGPFTWKVGEYPESGRIVADGEADDLETAQQQAEQAFAQAANQ